jgi:hypothetical protein
VNTIPCFGKATTDELIKPGLYIDRNGLKLVYFLSSKIVSQGQTKWREYNYYDFEDARTYTLTNGLMDTDRLPFEIVDERIVKDAKEHIKVIASQARDTAKKMAIKD